MCRRFSFPPCHAGDLTPSSDKRLPAAEDSAESGRSRRRVGTLFDGRINLLNESKLMQHLLCGRRFHPKHLLQEAGADLVLLQRVATESHAE